LRSIALTTDTSILTAVANDIDYSQVFSRQLSGLGRAGDVLIGISTSGKSQSVLEAIKLAETMKIKTIFLTGQNTPNLKSSLDCIIQIPSETTSHIQEGHITVGQLLCGLVENHFYG
jgi:D-sedoheptulose 7-phosphate isomerase